MLDANVADTGVHQAAGLATLTLGTATAGTRVIAVTSAQAQSGRTWVTMQIARAAARLGWRPIVIDAVAPRVVTALGGHVATRAARSLELLDVLDARAPLHEAVVRVGAIRLLDARRGLAALGDQGPQFLRALAMLRDAPSLVIVHTPDAQAAATMIGDAGAMLMVSRADPIAMQATYATLKRLAVRPGVAWHVAFNRAAPDQAARAFSMLRNVAQQFLGTRIESAASIPDLPARRHPDGAVPRALSVLTESIAHWPMPVLASAPR